MCRSAIPNISGFADWQGGEGREREWIHVISDQAHVCAASFAQVADTRTCRLHKWSCMHTPTAHTNGTARTRRFQIGQGLVVGCGLRVGDPWYR